ncbi:hypothetical protein NKR23_g8190 [Pleurostoma richardsiae]|uniref:Uncharacterized protein n=1 Tax=Pleurostoma richardsiae TaxID=41990 RepID=A0AA38VCY6_9PEZI|nr:hypothetical protein NKR23_g8190 [Pleurostoma richardsiae]
MERLDEMDLDFDRDALLASRADEADKQILKLRELRDALCDITSPSTRYDARLVRMIIGFVEKTYAHYKGAKYAELREYVKTVHLLSRTRRIGRHCNSIKGQAADLAQSDARAALAWKHAGQLFGLAEKCMGRVTEVLRVAEEETDGMLQDEGQVQMMGRMAGKAVFEVEREYYKWRATYFRPPSAEKRKASKEALGGQEPPTKLLKGTDGSASAKAPGVTRKSPAIEATTTRTGQELRESIRTPTVSPGLKAPRFPGSNGLPKHSSPPKVLLELSAEPREEPKPITPGSWKEEYRMLLKMCGVDDLFKDMLLVEIVTGKLQELARQGIEFMKAKPGARRSGASNTASLEQLLTEQEKFQEAHASALAMFDQQAAKTQEVAQKRLDQLRELNVTHIPKNEDVWGPKLREATTLEEKFKKEVEEIVARQEALAARIDDMVKGKSEETLGYGSKILAAEALKSVEQLVDTLTTVREWGPRAVLRYRHGGTTESRDGREVVLV